MTHVKKPPCPFAERGQTYGLHRYPPNIKYVILSTKQNPFQIALSFKSQSGLSELVPGQWFQPNRTNWSNGTPYQKKMCETEMLATSNIGNNISTQVSLSPRSTCTEEAKSKICPDLMDTTVKARLEFEQQNPTQTCVSSVHAKKTEEQNHQLFTCMHIHILRICRICNCYTLSFIHKSHRQFEQKLNQDLRVLK